MRNQPVDWPRRLLWRALDGVVFGALAALLCIVPLQPFLGLGGEAVADIVLHCVALWLVLALAFFHARALLIFLSGALIAGLFVLWTIDFLPFFELLENFNRFLWLTAPHADRLATPTFGPMLRGLCYAGASAVLLPVFYNKHRRAPVVVLAVLIFAGVLALGFASPIWRYSALLLPLLLLPLCWMYVRALFWRGQRAQQGQDDTPRTVRGYLPFQLRRGAVVLIPLLVCTMVLRVVPLDYRSQAVTTFVDTAALRLWQSTSPLFHLSTAAPGTHSGDVLLGGALHRTGLVHFTVEGGAGRFRLRTNVYDGYTGAGLLLADSDTQTALRYIPRTRPGTSVLRLTLDQYSGALLPHPLHTLGATSSAAQGNVFSTNELMQLHVSPDGTYGDSYNIAYWEPQSLGDLAQFPDPTMPLPPAQLHEHYTALPDDLPGETIALAQQLADEARAAVSPMAEELSAWEYARLEQYAVALYISNFVESNARYTTAPAAITHDDFVTGFLFETQEGYCTYFASATMVLLRAADIPARYVEGYLAAATTPDEPVREVTDHNLHAWVEVYFADLGFLSFDPTPAAYVPGGELFDDPTAPEPEIEPPTEQELLEQNRPDPNFFEEDPFVSELGDMSVFEEDETNPWPFVALGAGVVLLGFLAFVALRYRRLRALMDARDAHTAYAALRALLATRNIVPGKTESPRVFLLRAFSYTFLYGYSPTLRRGVLCDTADLPSEMGAVVRVCEHVCFARADAPCDAAPLLTLRDELYKNLRRERSLLHLLLRLPRGGKAKSGA